MSGWSRSCSCASSTTRDVSPAQPAPAQLVTADDDGVGAARHDGTGGWPSTKAIKEAPVRFARVAPRLAVLVVAAALTAGCDVAHLDGLNFRVDHRLHFLSPHDRSKQHLPLTIRWRMSDFAVAAPASAPPTTGAGYFVLFVDRQPIEPGQTLTSICRSDPFERGDANCPTTTYLQGKLIYPTTDDEVTLQSLPNIAGNKDKEQLHTFVVVLMDTAGRRIGESAWELDLRLPRIGG